MFYAVNEKHQIIHYMNIMKRRSILLKNHFLCVGVIRTMDYLQEINAQYAEGFMQQYTRKLSELRRSLWHQ